MAFWSANNASPIQQHHFTVEFGPGWEPYEVKSITMPQLEISEGSYRMGNHIYKYPGAQRWNDVTLTIVDTGDAASRLLAQLAKQGYGWVDNPNLTNSSAISKSRPMDSETIVIRQHQTRTVALEQPVEEEKTNGFLSFLGFSKKQGENKPGYVMSDDPIMGGFRYGYNSWYLKGAWIKSINFGTHDYSSDELISMEIVIAYDFAKMRFGGADQTTSMLGNIRQLTNGLDDPRAQKKAARKKRREERRAGRQARRAQRRSGRDSSAIPDNIGDDLPDG